MQSVTFKTNEFIIIDVTIVHKSKMVNNVPRHVAYNTNCNYSRKKQAKILTGIPPAVAAIPAHIQL